MNTEPGPASAEALSALAVYLDRFAPGTRERGRAYFKGGRVQALKSDGHRVQARVEGTELYETSLFWERDGWGSACSCPVETDCKHAYATGLAWMRQSDRSTGAGLAAKVLLPPVIHPVVRVHPTTGRPNLFVNPGFTSHIVGVSRVESDGLLRTLYEHMTQPEFVLRHRWRDGDVVIWDNRATMHYAVDDYGKSERRVRRVTIRGGLPVGPSGIESRVADDPLISIR